MSLLLGILLAKRLVLLQWEAQRSTESCQTDGLDKMKILRGGDKIQGSVSKPSSCWFPLKNTAKKQLTSPAFLEEVVKGTGEKIVPCKVSIEGMGSADGVRSTACMCAASPTKLSALPLGPSRNHTAADSY